MDEWNIDADTNGRASGAGAPRDSRRPGGLGDSWSLSGANPEPLATVSNDRVGWRILDNGQLKFLYPAGSMTSSQIGKMGRNLDQEQQKFLRPK